VPEDRPPGQALATRRAIADIVRAVALGSYGVIDVGNPPPRRWLDAIAGRPSGIAVSLDRQLLAIDVRLGVAHGVPIAEVARQVDSAVRFAIRRALHREVDRLTIRIASLAMSPGSVPPASREQAAEPEVGTSDLAESGTDVA
jgi:uncharacterized alkaline shock family protein YloU